MTTLYNDPWALDILGYDDCAEYIPQKHDREGGRRKGREKPIPRDNRGDPMTYDDHGEGYPDIVVGIRGVQRAWGKDSPLPVPHYSSDAWHYAHTVYGKRESGLHYDYSDRLWEWDYKKAEAAQKAANGLHPYTNGRSAAFWEAFLTHYFGKPTALIQVLAGVNYSNGYEYYVFGYRFTEQAAPASSTDTASPSEATNA